MAQSLGRPLLTAARLSPFERRCFTQFAPRMVKGGRGPAAHRGATPAEPSFRLQSKEMMTKTPDIGLLSETFIAPTGKNLPSIFHAPGALLRMRWIQLKSSLRDYFSLLILKITSPQGKRWYNRFVKLHRGRVVPTAIALHREMYTAFAAGDATTLRRICTDGIYDQFRARMAARPRGEKTVWELVKYNKRARIVSHRAARLPIDGAAVRQAVVRLSSRQKLSRYAADGRLVKGTGKERDVVEYLVVEKSYWNWQEGDWRVWGTTEETKLETVLQWQKDALDAGN